MKNFPTLSRALTVGNVTFTSAGTHALRVTVAGKNTSLSSSVFVPDRFTFTGR